MRVLVVDDEPAARRRLTIMLEELDVEVVGEAEHGLRALELVGPLRPDVLLLDIAMPEVDGLDVARHLSEPKPLIIFQTAYDEYALEAFEHEALDYVVKPVTLERLQQALARARRRLADSRRPALSGALLDKLAAAVAPGPGPRRPRLLVRDGDARRLVPYADIVRFVADEGIVHCHTRAGARHPVDYTLGELEERTRGRFVRASRGELVNVDYVTHFAGAGDGSATLQLAGGASVRVSRRRAGDVRRQLEG